MRFTFTEFNTEFPTDLVVIHDGPDHTDPVLLGHSGATIPNAVVSSASTVLITFYDGGGLGGQGFVLSIGPGESLK